jgi:hypothetical protein
MPSWCGQALLYLLYPLPTTNRGGGGDAVALLVDKLRYKLEDRGFDS